MSTSSVHDTLEFSFDGKDEIFSILRKALSSFEFTENAETYPETMKSSKNERLPVFTLNARFENDPWEAFRSVCGSFSITEEFVVIGCLKTFESD